MSDDEKPTWNAEDRSVEDCLMHLRQDAALLKGVLDAFGNADGDVVSNIESEAWWRLKEVAGEILQRIKALEDRLPAYVITWHPTEEPDGPDAEGAR